MSHNRIVVKKGTAILVALVILALGAVGTGLSTLYSQEGYSGDVPFVTVKRSYGFPLGWHGYSFTTVLAPVRVPVIYWFSLESLILDVAFWFAISFFVCLAVVKSATTVRKAASKILSVINIVVMYFFASLSFLVVGLGLCLVTQTVESFPSNSAPGIEIVPSLVAFHPYLDLGLRLFGFGIFLVVATFYQSLVRERKTFQKHFPTIS